MQEDVQVDLAKIKKQLSRMPNWKSPGPNGVQGYWIKNFTSVHRKIENQLNRCLQENRVPLWMVTGKTLFYIKEVEKGDGVSDFRTITFLPIIWKFLRERLPKR